MISIEFMVKEAKRSLAEGDVAAAKNVTHQAIAEGLDLTTILAEGFFDGIREAGDLFGEGKLALAELILAADCIKSATEIIDAAWAKQEILASQKETLKSTAPQDSGSDLGE